MKAVSSLLIAALALALTPAQALETYQIDKVHSSANFKIKHLVSKVSGRFTDFSGVIAGDPAKPEETQVSVEINTASINTNDEKRDEHLRSPEFFDAAQFPHISFVSKKVTTTGEDSAFLIGDMTMRGVTKEVILQVKFLGRAKDAKGLLRTGWEARTVLKRSDFGLTWSKAIEGTQVVGNDVEIELNIEAVEAKDPEKPAVTTETTSAPVATPAPAANSAPAAPAGLPAVFSSPSAPAPNAPVSPSPLSAAPGTETSAVTTPALPVPSPVSKDTPAPAINKTPEVAPASPAPAANGAASAPPEATGAKPASNDIAPPAADAVK